SASAMPPRPERWGKDWNGVFLGRMEMSELDGVWPPKPDRTAGNKDVKRCTHCNRPLLTQTSMLCNWCGAKIEDDEYQRQAAENRHARDAAERASIEEQQEETARYGPLGRLRRRAKAQKTSLSGNDLPDLDR
ncbi:MAG TPA: hypothetical protein VHB77_01070, partial [Planctomycetaceae bacterium]|nr:hypothetical protein [Planctomycetaceae bacterium]